MRCLEKRKCEGLEDRYCEKVDKGRVVVYISMVIMKVCNVDD